MAELPIIHSHQPSNDWIDRLATLRAEYSARVDGDPEKPRRDARWWDASLVYHSLRLKGLELALADVEAGSTASRGPLAAIERVRRAAAAGDGLSPELLLELNALVDPEHGGRLRQSAPIAAYRGHSAPPAEAIASLLENAESWFTAPSFDADFHPVDQAALALTRVCDIQPFPTSNEATARIAASLFTLRAGFPPIVVHHELEEEYRSALLHAIHMDTQPIVEFLAKCVELAYADVGVTL